MRKMNIKKRYYAAVIGTVMIVGLAGCTLSKESAGSTTTTSDEITADASETTAEISASDEAYTVAAVSSAGSGILDTADMFTERDLLQTAELTDAIYYTVADNEDIHITSAGVYVISGSAKNVTIYVEADEEDKVQLVLNGLTITNEDFPCIYVTEADKVFVTTTDTENTLTVTGEFAEDDSTNTDGVIFSKTDLTLNGTGVMTISSTDNGVVCKDDLRVTGGTYHITAATKAFEANDSIRIADGDFVLNAGTDGIHAENDDDDSVGYVYIAGGTYDIDAGDDGIHATTVIQIDGGTYDMEAGEALEGTYVQINDATIVIQASDDGINAANKSGSYTPTVEINGGDITITMGTGDTDGIDSNGNIIVNGGIIRITGNSTFDYDGEAQLNGGTIICNGEEVDEIPNQTFGGMDNGEMPEGDFPGGMNNGEKPEGDFPGGMNNGDRPEGDFPGGMNNGERPEGGFPGGMNDGERPQGNDNGGGNNSGSNNSQSDIQ